MTTPLVTLITGASQGIGAAMAGAFASPGHSVVLATRSPDRLEKVAGELDGDRPRFSFPGAWMYAGDLAIVHLVGVDEPAEARTGQIEHFAITGDDLASFRSRLQNHGVTFDERPVPGTNLLQVHVSDPDGNHIHVDFVQE